MSGATSTGPATTSRRNSAHLLTSLEVGVLLSLAFVMAFSAYAMAAQPLERPTAAPAPSVLEGGMASISVAQGVPWSSGVTPTGALPASTIIGGGLQFQAVNPQGQQAVLNAIYTPGSPEYHHYLVGDQFDQLFAPSASLQSSLLGYLEGHGIQVTQTSVYLWNLLGTPSEMGSAFGTTFVQGTLNGRSGYAPTGPLELPSAFQDFTSVSGGFQTVNPPALTSLLPAPHPILGAGVVPAAVTPNAAFSINITSPYILQYQNHNTAIAFPPTNLNETWTVTITGGTAPYHVVLDWGPGSGETIVTSSASVSGIHSYYEPGQADYCDSTVCGNVTVWVNDSAATPDKAEYVVGLVPGVSPQTDQLFYDVAPLARLGFSGQGTTIGLNEMCDPDYPTADYTSDLTTYSTDMGLPVPTIKLTGTGATTCSPGYDGWSGETLLDMESVHALAPNATIEVDLADSTTDEGDCAWDGGTSGIFVASNSWTGTATQSCWTDAVSHGMSYQTSSGDCGANANYTTVAPTDYTDNVGVGGTDVYPQPSGIFLREFAWNGTIESTCDNDEGSTGGYSSAVAAPSYQTGMQGFTGTDRGYPDVGAIGGTWFWMVYEGGVTLSAGTSLACPSWTAMIDLMWQYNSTAAKGQGFANWDLYAIAKGANYLTAFHDITVGNNIHGTKSPGTGFTAHAGWDSITGIGSADVGKLAEFLASQNGNSAAFGSVTPVIATNVTLGYASLAVDFGADVVGGASNQTGYHYIWNFGDGSPLVYTDNPWTIHDYTTPGGYWASVTVTQGTNTGASNGIEIHVMGLGGVITNPPTVTAPTAAPTSIDVTQSATFTTTASGGTGTYSSYAWTVSPTTGLSCTASTTTGSTSCTASAAGIYTVSVTVTDSSSTTSSPATSAAFHVYPDPTVSVPKPSATSVAVGGTLSFTTTIGLAGSGGDSYSWTESPATGLGCTASTTTTLSCTPATAGTYNATAKVTDSNGGTGHNTSVTVTVTGGSPSVTAPTASKTSIDVGQSVTFTTVASGGSGSYSTFTWTVSPTSGLGCTASTTTGSTSCSGTVAGIYTVSVVVKDSTGATSSSATSAAFHEYPDPTVAPPSPSATSVAVGGSLSFTTTPGLPGSGTSSTDTYSWSESPATGLGCSASTSTTLSCTPATAGTYTAKATITDPNGGTGSNTSALVTVTSPNTPTVSPPVASPASTDVGYSSVFSTTASGGSDIYSSYAWTVSPSTGLSCSGTSSSTTCSASAVGNYTVSVTVTDSEGHTSAVASSALFQVYPAPAVSDPLPSPASPAVGTSLTLTSTLTQPGAGSDNYGWTFSAAGIGCDTANALSVTCTPTTIGTYTATIDVADANGGKGSATSASITVSGNGLTVSAAATPNPTSTNTTVTFSATVTETSGGAGTYTYSWHFADGTASSEASPTHAYSVAGTYTVIVFVNDTAGHEGQATVTVTVSWSSSSNSNAGAGFLGSDLLWVLVAVVAAAAIIAVVAVRHRKKSKEAEAAAAGAEGPGAPPGPYYGGGYYGGGPGGAAPPPPPPPPGAPPQ